MVSIPFEQGDVFRQATDKYKQVTSGVSIPFEQGDVFRHIKDALDACTLQSQSLSSRAMSFDARI